eukprot:6473749-Amphidinium_carterae.1
MMLSDTGDPGPPPSLGCHAVHWEAFRSPRYIGSNPAVAASMCIAVDMGRRAEVQPNVQVVASLGPRPRIKVPETHATANGRTEPLTARLVYIVSCFKFLARFLVSIQAETAQSYSFAQRSKMYHNPRELSCGLHSFLDTPQGALLALLRAAGGNKLSKQLSTDPVTGQIDVSQYYTANILGYSLGAGQPSAVPQQINVKEVLRTL